MFKRLDLFSSLLSHQSHPWNTYVLLTKKHQGLSSLDFWCSLGFMKNDWVALTRDALVPGERMEGSLRTEPRWSLLWVFQVLESLGERSMFPLPLPLSKMGDNKCPRAAEEGRVSSRWFPQDGPTVHWGTKNTMLEVHDYLRGPTKMIVSEGMRRTSHTEEIFIRKLKSQSSGVLTPRPGGQGGGVHWDWGDEPISGEVDAFTVLVPSSPFCPAAAGWFKRRLERAQVLISVLKQPGWKVTNQRSSAQH